jgi:hypothetical protein
MSCYDQTGMPDRPNAEPEHLRQWVDTWRRAGVKLEEIRRREIQALVTLADTQEAIRQLFGTGKSIDKLPQRITSGLVEQQAWFARLRAKETTR